MICHRKIQSQIREQLTSTTGFSRSKGSGSSVEGGVKRFSFSRTAVRKHVQYTSLDTNTGTQKAKSHNTKNHLDNTNEREQSTKLIYRDANRHYHDTNAKSVDTNQDFRETKQEKRDTGSNLRDTNQEFCDTNHEIRYTNQEMRETEHAQSDTYDEQRDTDEKIRDMDESARRKSDESLDDGKSISSDSCATLHRESDALSITGETIPNTNYEHGKQNENTDSQLTVTIENDAAYELEQNAQENSELDDDDLNTSARNEPANIENELQNTENESQIPKTLDEGEMTIELGGNEESEICNISERFSEFIRTKSIRETDL